MLERLPSLVTIGTFCVMSFAAAHEWAYFSVIGPEYQTLYATSDYITLLIWGAGTAFFIVVIFGLIQIVVYRSDDFTLPPFSAKKTFTGFMDRHFDIVLILFSATIQFFFGTSQVNFWAYMLLVWFVFRGILYVLSHEKTKKYSTGWFAAVIYGLPIGMIFAYGVGKNSAYDDISQTQTRYELRLKDHFVSRSVNVLRFLEKGAIIFDPQTKMVEFIRTDAINRISTKAQELDNRSFVCKHWDLCPPSQKKKGN